jgi:hypothetical protein
MAQPRFGPDESFPLTDERLVGAGPGLCWSDFIFIRTKCSSFFAVAKIWSCESDRVLEDFFCTAKIWSSDSGEC